MSEAPNALLLSLLSVLQFTGRDSKVGWLWLSSDVLGFIVS